MRDFADDNPHVTVRLLRFSNVLGTDIHTPLAKALRLPVVPSIFGFDPRFQFVHEDDVVRALLFVLENDVPASSTWRATACCRGARSPPSAASACSLPPIGHQAGRRRCAASASTCRPRWSTCSRYGRGVDNRRLKAAGFTYRYTSAGAVRFAEASRLRARSAATAGLPLRAGRRAVLPPLPLGRADPN